jgi:hypothetical protein
LKKKNAKLKQLEEDKKIAIFLEKYEEVIAIDKKIDDVKSGRSTTTPTQQANSLGMMSSALSNPTSTCRFRKCTYWN